MNKKKTMEGNVCSQCGGAIDSSTSNCTVCGGTILELSPSHKNKKLVFWSVFFTTICCLLLTISLVLLVLLLFIHALNENVILPAAGFISSDWLALFFDSWYPLLFGDALVLIPILIIVLLNTQRVRRIFFAIGCSSIISAILSITSAIIKIHTLKLLTGEWQDVLVNATTPFNDFSVVCAFILIVIGATCLSIYSCIVPTKGGKHEKDN